MVINIPSRPKNVQTVNLIRKDKNKDTKEM